jgi:peptide/nickel transport system substrate-binding protein
MRRLSRTVALSLSLVLAVFALAGPAQAQAKNELVVVLSSFSAETLDPVLQGHIVKYYLSPMFDYLVGTTPDGNPSPAGGIATKWENSADHKRWTFHLRKGVKFHTGDERRHRDQGTDLDHSDVPVPVAVDRGNGVAEEVHRGQRR